MKDNDEPTEFRNSSYEFDRLWEIIRDEESEPDEKQDAVAAIKDMAHDGDPYAQYLLGTLYQDGPLLIPDSEKAKYWLEQAAENRRPAAMYALGKLCLSDPEVLDIELGFRKLYAAAEEDHDGAMYRLGKEYLTGRNVSKDVGKAVDFFTQAAERGNPYAQYMLGKLYLTGEEVPQDRELARALLRESQAQGNQYAGFLLEHMDESRSPQLMLGVTRLLHHMSRIFRDHSLPKEHPAGIQIDRKQRQKILEKRRAMGLKDGGRSGLKFSM